MMKKRKRRIGAVLYKVSWRSSGKGISGRVGRNLPCDPQW